MSDLLSLAQAATRLGISRQRLHLLIQQGRVPALRVGAAWVLRAADLTLPEARKPGRPRKSSGPGSG